MNNHKSNVKIAFALSIVLSAFGSLPVYAEDNGFTLDDAIRNEIFQELKTNVEYLYQHSRLVVPTIDTDKASRIADSNTGAGFVLPVNTGPGQIKGNVDLSRALN